MIDKNFIINIIDEFLLSRTDLFWVDVKILPGNHIQVKIDGDKGVNVADCVALSRAIEGSLDRENEDFELEVGSGGIDTPLKYLRQYHNNTGRNLRVTTLEGEIIRGKISGVDDHKVTVTLRVKKKVETKEIPYTTIKEAIITIE
jgi:ribosome maturation factor RimP